MRQFSTEESVRTGEASVLAIVETLGAMSASVWIGLELGTWWHVFVGAAIAPFLMLRTDRSCEYAWIIAQRLLGGESARSWVDWLFRVIHFALTFALALLILFALPKSYGWLAVISAIPLSVGLPGVIARFLGTLAGVCVAPTESVKAIPRNWWRTIAVIDFARPPDVLPFPDRLEWKRPDFPMAGDLCGGLPGKQWFSLVSRRLDRLFSPPIRITLWTLSFLAPAVCFRLSLKSTALIWAPLIWAVSPTKPADEEWRAHLKLRATSDFSCIVAIFSIVVLLGFISKYGLFIAEHELARHFAAWQSWFGPGLGEFAAAFFRPGEFPIWQFASAINSVLAIILFLKFRSWLRRAEVNLPMPDARIDQTLAAMYFFRRLLTSYAVICNGVIAFQLARKLPMPEIGSRLFPWL